jgi:hypothetical protein
LSLLQIVSTRAFDWNDGRTLAPSIDWPVGNSTIVLSDDSIQWEAFDTGFVGIWAITAWPADLYAIDTSAERSAGQTANPRKRVRRHRQRAGEDRMPARHPLNAAQTYGHLPGVSIGNGAAACQQTVGTSSLARPGQASSVSYCS